MIAGMSHDEYKVFLEQATPAEVASEHTEAQGVRVRYVLIWVVLFGVLGAIADAATRVHPGFAVLFVAAFVVPTVYVKRMREEDTRLGRWKPS
jgi:hypothetical protein